MYSEYWDEWWINELLSAGVWHWRYPRPIKNALLFSKYTIKRSISLMTHLLNAMRLLMVDSSFTGHEALIRCHKYLDAFLAICQYLFLNPDWSPLRPQPGPLSSNFYILENRQLIY